jgi:hypothetical protein
MASDDSHGVGRYLYRICDRIRQCLSWDAARPQFLSASLLFYYK